MRIKEEFIEARAEEYLAVPELQKQSTFIEYLLFCKNLEIVNKKYFEEHNAVH